MFNIYVHDKDILLEWNPTENTEIGTIQIRINMILSERLKMVGNENVSSNQDIMVINIKVKFT